MHKVLSCLRGLYCRHLTQRALAVPKWLLIYILRSTTRIFYCTISISRTKLPRQIYLLSQEGILSKGVSPADLLMDSALHTHEGCKWSIWIFCGTWCGFRHWRPQLGSNTTCHSLVEPRCLGVGGGRVWWSYFARYSGEYHCLRN